VGVYFSYETRNHTFFGAFNKGYCRDYSDTLKMLLRSGISAHTLFAFPDDPERYPLILVPSPAAMTPQEQAALRGYAQKGGKVIITGPSAYPGCKHSWVLPVKPECAPADLFQTVRDGVWTQAPAWQSATTVAETEDPDQWQSVEDNVLYHPRRTEALKGELLEDCRSWGKTLPVTLLEQTGYFATLFRGEDGTTLQLLAEDYDTDIDHHLDEIRYHRSRVNYITKVIPVGISRRIVLSVDSAPQVYTPFNEGSTQVELLDGICKVTLPADCPYAIIHFPE
jgi:hypothetical protein